MQVCISLLWFMAVASGAASTRKRPEMQHLELTDYGLCSIDARNRAEGMNGA